MPTIRNDKTRSKLDADDLNELRRNRMFEIIMNQIMKEFAIYLFFSVILYVVAFSNLSSSSFQYNQLFLNTFVHKHTGENLGLNDVNFITALKFLNIIIVKLLNYKISNVDDFWSWSIDKLSLGLRANTWYNGSQPYGLAGFLNDFSSRMVGFATLRQLRVKNGM